ncbi:MAG: tRNA (adenosine(37)-N6)-threonylcarbamoyltransferase complex ATPase subunit type 1 TsaE [Thermodesulfobacteriota bacterium]
MAKAITVTCKNPGETFNLGIGLGEILAGGDVVTLQGELGAGKTWFTKGIAHGLGITDTNAVTSPSFTIINEYQGRLPLFHMDFYRLENKEAASDLGLEEYLYGQGVTVIEWPERLAGIIPAGRLEVRFIFSAEDKREIELIPHGKDWEERIAKIAENLVL